jgi:hypothetical protein
VGHIVVYAILAFVLYGWGYSNGRKEMMGQVRGAAEALRNLLK